MPSYGIRMLSRVLAALTMLAMPLCVRSFVPLPCMRSPARLVRHIKHSSSRSRNAAAGVISSQGIGGLSRLFKDHDRPTSSSNKRFVFVGGKGGVGKTSSAAAIAVSLADHNLKTLVVSTDPAHSLSDSLAEPLPGGIPRPVFGCENLWALEIDVEKALNEFRSSVASLDVEELTTSLGIPAEIARSVGMDDVLEIIRNPPPGIDEIVALTSVLKLSKEGGYDRIVIDTAPTGHTLRLLQLPTFVETFAAKLIKLRAKIMGLVGVLQGLFGGGGSVPNKGVDLDAALAKLETLQANMHELNAVLHDPTQTEFVCVCIPTDMAVAESNRLLTSLQQEGIRVSSIVVNQLIGNTEENVYLQRRKAGQEMSFNTLEASLPADISLSKVPYVDTELSTVYGLRYLGQIAYTEGEWDDILSNTNPQISIFGGKGGVGKTSCAAAMGVALSDALTQGGGNTIIVSTDPAHSLGDVLKVDLSSGHPVRVDSGSSGTQLWALEIDPKQALEEFKEIIQESLETDNNEDAEADMGMGMGGLGKELQGLLTVLDNPPPGVDEIVALSKVITLFDNGLDGFTVDPADRSSASVLKTTGFKNIILDTAPTGHTLRMLSLPVFLDRFLDNAKNLRNKLKSFGGLLGGLGLGSEDQENTQARDRLKEFQEKMKRLESLLKDSKTTQFVVVTIPTVLAVSETLRLITALKEGQTNVKHVVVNQVISDSVVLQDTFLDRIRAQQQKQLERLNEIAHNKKLEIIPVPYFSTEMRTVYGLRVMAEALFAPPANQP